MRRRKIKTVLLGVVLLLATGGFWSVHCRMRDHESRAMQPERAANQLGSPTEAASGSFRYTNRLIHEKSPYLQLHAHNPVDWYPWSAEAFEKAQREQKPIFLSIGYYTCHWCHVMERESFSDPAIAEVMNRSFVSIKVDREERPDLDRIYLTFVEATTGSGGWPMSVFLTSDRKPFFGGTYFPKDDDGGRPGFRTLLERVADAWGKDREKIAHSAAEVTRALQESMRVNTADEGVLQRTVLEKTYQQIQSGYDAAHGGFGQAPKFPRPVALNFLLRYYASTGEKEALEMTLGTLRAMARGGIHDPLGGGFHRYATDAKWRVPHFEKMLYDQAQLATVYLDAYQITRDAALAAPARDILDFVLREMRGPEGGFYSALDADSQIVAGRSEQSEGAFYAWEAKEIERVLGAEGAAIFDFHFGVEPGGNVPAEQDLRGELKRKNVLYQAHSVAETAQHFGKPDAEILGVLGTARKKLAAARAVRPRPPLDDKVLTAWNGLMISALARASQVLDEPKYLAAAEGSARLIQSKLHDAKSGTLRRRYRAGETAVDGFLDDYAFLIQGLLDLYEASFDVRWLSWAMQLQTKQDALFWDAGTGGYFTTRGGDPAILFQTRESYDGAEPSPNSVAALNLLRLGEMGDRKEWREKARKTLAVFSEVLGKYPEAMPQMAAALDFELARTKQIVIAGRPGAADTRGLLRLVHARYLPHKILLLADGAEGQKQLAQWLPFLTGVTRKQGRATAYVCENYVCKLPTADPRMVARLLDGKS